MMRYPGPDEAKLQIMKLPPLYFISGMMVSCFHGKHYPLPNFSSDVWMMFGDQLPLWCAAMDIGLFNELYMVDS